jgi:hypothetical protein
VNHRPYCDNHSNIAVDHNLLDELILLIQHHMADVMTKIAISADMTNLTTTITGLRERLRVRVRSTSIGMPGGSAHEGVCIAAGVAAKGGYK